MTLRESEREELGKLVAWAIRFAAGWAAAKGLPEGELVSAALLAVEGGWRTYQEGEGRTRAQHVRRRVRGELIDASHAEGRLREREVLLDSAEEDDDDSPAWEASVVDVTLAALDEQILRRERQAMVDDAVAKLTDVERRVYALRFREWRSWNEVASVLRIPERTARWHGQNVREQLTAALATWDEAE